MGFIGYVEQMLAPTLSECDTVIMDNLASYKVAGVPRNDRSERGALLRSFTARPVAFTAPDGCRPSNPSVARWGDEIV
jgi:hypothetical protein